MFKRIKNLVLLLSNAIETMDRLEKVLVIQARKIVLLEQRQDKLFDDVVSFLNKQRAVEEKHNG